MSGGSEISKEGGHRITDDELRSFVGAFGKVCGAMKKLVLVIEGVMWVGVAVGALLVVSHPLVSHALQNMQPVVLRVAALAVLFSVSWLIQADIDRYEKDMKELVRIRQRTKGVAGMGMSRIVRDSIVKLRMRDRSEHMTAASDVISQSSLGVTPTPTPRTPQQGTPTAAVYAWWLSKLESSVWETYPLVDPDGLDAQMWHDPSSSLPFVLVKSTFECNPAAFVSFLTGTTPEIVSTKKGFDSNLADMKCLESNEEERTSVGYTRISLPWPLSHRDMVYKSEISHPSEGVTQIVLYDVTHASAPPTSDCVRASTKAFYRVSAIETGQRCYVEFASCMDPKGSIPHNILSLFKSKTAGFFCKMRSHLAALEKAKQD